MLLLLLATTPTSFAAEPRSQVVTVNFTGIISPQMFKRFLSALENVSGDPFPAGLIVHVDSPGGDGIIAMHMGRLAREHKAHIFVKGRCSSACVFLLAGGVVRSATDGAIGLHRGAMVQHQPGVGDVPADVKRENVRAMLDAAERQVAAFFEEMGMSAQLFKTMQAVPHADMKRLSRAEAESLGLVGVDPAYARSRSDAGRRRFGFDEAGFAVRALAAQSCPAVEPAKAFIDCYTRSLQGTLGPE